jgi:hypothetical protein
VSSANPISALIRTIDIIELIRTIRATAKLRGRGKVVSTRGGFPRYPLPCHTGVVGHFITMVGIISERRAQTILRQLPPGFSTSFTGTWNAYR